MTLQATAPPRAELRKDALHVLVVEDDPLFQGLVRGWLEADGAYRVSVAGTAAEAREQAARDAPDLVLLDLNLPDSRGMDTLEAVQQAGRALPVVVLTAQHDEELGVEAVRRGAQDFVQKAAVDPDALRRNLLYAVERRRLEDMHQRVLRHEMESRRLRDIDHAKNRFYQAAARGLRGSVQPLRLGLQVLQMELQESLKASQADTLGSLQSHVAHLERLIGDLVDIAAVQTGALEMERRATDLRRVAVAAGNRWRPRARSNRLDLVVEAEPDTMVDGDPRRLGQVFDHLLDNALRHTPAGGRVRVAVRHERQHVVATVADNGVGVHPDDLPLLTEAFSPKAGDEDRGVGLAVCKAIVEQHGGSFEVISAGEGAGTTARVVLPVLGDLGD